MSDNKRFYASGRTVRMTPNNNPVTGSVTMGGGVLEVNEYITDHDEVAAKIAALLNEHWKGV